MKKLIVNGLEAVCTVTDFFWFRAPYVKDYVYKKCRLAEWSFVLDERWQTGQWKGET